MDRLIVLFLILSFTLKCRNKEEYKYDFRIPEAKMVSMLIDLNIADAATATHDQKQRDSVSALYYTQVTKIHHLTKSNIDSILLEIQKKPELYLYLSTIVSDSLKSMEQIRVKKG